MESSQVPFAGGVVHALRDDADKSSILREIQDAFGVHVAQRRYDRLAHHASMIRKNAKQFMASLCAGGAPYWMYLTRAPTGNGVVVLIDLRIQAGHFLPRMYMVHLRFDACLFDRTLMEGELVKSSSTAAPWTLLMSDLIGVMNTSLLKTRVPLLQRLQRLQRLIQTQFNRNDAFDPFQLAVREHFPVQDLLRVLRDVASKLNYGVRGVWLRPTAVGRGGDLLHIFAAKSKVEGGGGAVGVEDGTDTVVPSGDDADDDNGSSNANDDDDATKSEGCDDDGESLELGGGSEEEEEKTQSFFVRRTPLPDVYHLYASADSARASKLGDAITACVPTLAASQWLKEQFKHEAHSVREMQFVFHKGFQKWVPRML